MYVGAESTRLKKTRLNENPSTWKLVYMEIRLNGNLSSKTKVV